MNTNNLGAVAKIQTERDGDPGFAESYAEASTPSLPKIT
jgi:hypothetical protein